MTNHYYSENPETAHDLHQWSFELAGKNFQFVTDSGVFSRDTVDYGSRALIEHFETEGLPAGTLLDVGCGYGPIGMALAHQTEHSVEMIDVNNRAVMLAQENAKRNNIEADIHQSNIYENVHQKEYAAIVSNPPIRAGKKVVHQILSEAEPLLKIGGTLTIVIQKKQGAPSAKSKMEEVFGNAEIVAKDKGYYIIRSTKE
ncbi:class I SAM-dependent methyltransferase [Enterococcus dongliensis]|uniref:Class I SAM-dependent methyltransferase n=1 Tax=Enterococcus dongliensis TaxID=2559925 RepID=A0AAW8TK54_9ENTE|nr:class I SAM-dependent methyltransferase [Enterococcus dongliensis]MDT2596523.1 class I SAM-dependent methyltransferase [Enterococcus dongliensis]MDT2604145.1 class I SAM-dependent methyltransferase [Enterococcus dongliensis]MDT2634565.1 class I SAM-dependent methyltransferase [Enterococcus dongliensis]MDT2636515.1 class I SAM-dependent methyltransferase [Enterococcus dongliensis]MDT2642191.1 class I SAM-dependent methyltransferase [Enterococcus dongliensis]